MKPWTKLLTTVLVEVMCLSPLAAKLVLAADPTPSPTLTPAQQCSTIPSQFTNTGNAKSYLAEPSPEPDVTPDEVDPSEGAPDPTPTPSASPVSVAPTTTTLADVPAPDNEDAFGEGTAPTYQTVDENELKQNPFFDEDSFKAFVDANRGWQDSTNQNLWNFCTLFDMTQLNSVVPVGYDLANYFDTLLSPENKVDFQNPIDKFALTGEPCTLFDPKTRLCDETKHTVPVTDSTGQPILDTSGNPVTQEVPEYYDDSAWPNGVWDAPKADIRLLKTLDYLVTPTERGGSGREYVKVAKILQFSPTNPEFSNVGPSPSPTSGASPSATEPTEQDSSHAYDIDPKDAGNPNKISQAMDISQIDDVRITTQVTQERRLGGNTVTDSYTKVPIQVSWQTDAGAAAAPLVGPNLYQSALSSFSLDLASLLDGMGLTANIDLSSVNDLKSLGDVAELIGKSLLGQLLNSPNGSLTGVDFPGMLDQIGRAYLASQLGLPTAAFKTGTTVEDLIQSVGRATVEKAFNFPEDSLTGATSDEIFQTLGRRELETIMGVSEGTLLPLGNITQTELLERLGAGKIEERFGLNPGSIREPSFSKVMQIPKMKLMFAKGSDQFVDEALSLAYQDSGSGKDLYGFSASDYQNPTLNLIQNQSDANFARYKQLVGARVLASGIGALTSGTSTAAGVTNNPQVQDFISTIKNTFGFIYHNQQRVGPVPPAGESVVLDTKGATIGGFNGFVTLPTSGALWASGAFSAADWAKLVTQMLTDSAANTYGTAQNGNTAQYNGVQGLWKPLLQGGLTTIETKLSQTDQIGVGDQIATTNLTNARALVSTALGQARSYTDGLLTQIQANGQSGRSAGLDLPGSFQQTNPDGTLTGTTIYSSDPVTAFLNGSVSPQLMELIGKTYAAKSMTDDKSAIQTFVSTISTSLNNFGSLDSLGIGTDKWLGAGFSKDDFDRIFTKNLSTDVFDRIGQQELLATLFNKSDLATAISPALGGLSGQVSTIVGQAGQLIEGLSFYTTRFQQLQGIAQQISSKLDSVSGLSATDKQSFKDLTSFNDVSSIETVIDKSAQFEPLFGVIGNSSNLTSLLPLVQQAQHIMEEIAAGHALSLTQSPSGAPKTPNGVIRDGCFKPSDLQAFLGNKGNAVSSLATQVASCRVDDALNLPLGTSYAWYQSHDYTLDGLSLAIGKTYAKDTGLVLSDDAAKAYGKTFLESVVVDKLLSAIPGLSSTFKKLGFKPEDIVSLLNGNGEQVLRRMGGSMMDSYFHWTPGTAAQIILPQCPDSTGKLVQCTGTDATNARLAAIAQMGLKELGITLNFPTGFSLITDPSSPLAAFDLTTNYGISRISETLGLSKNSFYGTFSDVRSRNKPQQMLQALGWYQSAGIRNLNSLIAALTALRSTDVSTADESTTLDGTIARVQAAIDGINNHTLDTLTDPSSLVWVDGQEATEAQSLLNYDTDAYNSLFSSLNGSVSSSNPTLLADILSALGKASSATLGSADTYANQIKAFKTRTTGMDGQLGLSAGTFKGFITGSVRAENMAKNDGKRELVNTLADAALDKLLAGTPFAALPATFKVLTKTAACPDGMGIGDFLINVSGNTNAACTIQNVSLGDIFSGKDPLDQSKRAFLYDTLLSRTWGMQIEKDLHVQPGTLRAIAIQPWRAGEIAIDQGIRLVGNEIFKLAGLGGPDTDENKQLLVALHTALMAGFCPVDPASTDSSQRPLLTSPNQLCTFNFNGQRSFASLQTSLNQMLLARYNQPGNDSTKISLVDVAVVFIGGLQGAEFLGAMDIAKQLDDKLLGNDPKAQAFKISYNDLRNAFGQFTLTAADYQKVIAAAQVQFVRGYYKCNNPSEADQVCAQSDGDILTSFLVGSDATLSLADRATTLNDIGSQAKVDAPNMLKSKALASLQYNIYDIAAFQVDHDIPRGFSHAMLAGSPQEKYRFLALYLANKLNLGQSVFGGLLTNQMVADLSLYVANGFKGNIGLDEVAALDSWVGKESKELFGISLPAGTVQGLFAWGSTGFKASTFDTSKQFNVGGKLYSPIGTVLKNWGISQILNWADKSFGFKAGSAFQIYQAASDVIKAEQFLTIAASPAGQAQNLANNVVSQLFGNGKTVDSVAVAKANLTAAEATLVAVVINVVFASEIGDAEKTLGLVPGTGALAVTILVELLMGVPVSPITIALFVGINLFGVYAVQVDVRASADGYYPFTGQYGVARYTPQEYISPDPYSGEFDAKNPSSYRQGIEHAAQFKVNNFLQDILLFPDRWSAATGDDPTTLRVSQIFTGRSEDVGSLDDLASRPFPYGFGNLEDRATFSTDPNTGEFVAVPNAGFRSGIFSSDAFNGFIHIRF